MPAPNHILSALLAPIIEAVTKAISAAYDAGGAATAQKISAAIGKSLEPTPAPRMFYESGGAQVLARWREMNQGSPQQQAMELVKVSPQKRGAQNRVAPGVVKKAVLRVIQTNPEGISRDGVRKVASDIMGQQIKEGSLKQSLRLLTKGKKIENRNRLWFPRETAAQEDRRD